MGDVGVGGSFIAAMFNRAAMVPDSGDGVGYATVPDTRRCRVLDSGKVGTVTWLADAQVVADG